MACRPAGTLGATATYAGVRPPTLSEPGDEREYGSDYPLEVRQQLIDAVYAGQPFRTLLSDLGPDLQSGVGTHQDRREVVGRAGGDPPKRP
jgi:hypothetical protein